MYVVAIPSYKRPREITHKTLHTLSQGGIDPSTIHIFVANESEYNVYLEAVPRALYGHLIVGVLGIAAQRTFITRYFNSGTYIVSMDDDIEQVEELCDGKLRPVCDLNALFLRGYSEIMQHGLHLWGVYPVRNPFFMRERVTKDLRFIIGFLHGYICDHDIVISCDTKDDYENTILHYQKDNGVLRFNNITAKQRYYAPGGCGMRAERALASRMAQQYLVDNYPEYVRPFVRKDGRHEVKLIQPRSRL